MQEDKRRRASAVVVSRSGDKTVKVAIEYKIRHPKYGKYISQRTTFAVHDPSNQAKVGDVVEVIESKPFSKTKSWQVVRVLQSA